MPYDLKTLAAQGFEGLVDGWVATLRAAREEDGKKPVDVTEDRLVTRLLPEYLGELEEAEGAKAVLEGQLAATKGPDDESEEGTSDDDEEEQLSEAEFKALKRELAQARKRLKQLHAALVERLQEARAGLFAADCEGLVLGALRGALAGHLGSYCAAHRREVVAAVGAWRGKYHTSLRKLEAAREDTRARLRELTRMLGYAA